MHVTFDPSQSCPYLVMIRWSPCKPPESCIGGRGDGGEWLTNFMRNGCRGRLRVQQLVISFAFQHGVRLYEARFGLPPFGKEGCKDVSADRHEQDGRLRAPNTVGDQEARVTEMPDAVDRRPDDRNRNQEGTGRGKRWPRTGGKPQQDRKRPGDRQQDLPG